MEYKSGKTKTYQYLRFECLIKQLNGEKKSKGHLVLMNTVIKLSLLYTLS